MKNSLQELVRRTCGRGNGTTHSITLLADSLAVMCVFEKLGLAVNDSSCEMQSERRIAA